MNNEKRNIDEMFSRFNGEWDIDEPAAGHEDRFFDRLAGKKKKTKTNLLYKIAIPAAAAIVIMLGIMLTFNPKTENNAVAMSPKAKETQVYFASIINKELAKVQKENSPETKKIVQDALVHMQLLEKDYDKITHDLAQKGENKQLIHAMITNFQTRISFLEDVLVKIENVKKIKESYHENNQT
jgi:hypothetical protein